MITTVVEWQQGNARKVQKLIQITNNNSNKHSDNEDHVAKGKQTSNTVDQQQSICQKSFHRKSNVEQTLLGVEQFLSLYGLSHFVTYTHTRLQTAFE